VLLSPEYNFFRISLVFVMGIVLVYLAALRRAGGHGTPARHETS
jgi:hypothetical protein